MRSHSRKYLYQKKRQSRILFVTNAVTTSQMLQQNGGEAVKHLNPPPQRVNLPLLENRHQNISSIVILFIIAL